MCITAGCFIPVIVNLVLYYFCVYMASAHEFFQTPTEQLLTAYKKEQREVAEHFGIDCSRLSKRMKIFLF